jgi:hypothetical protein
MTDEAQRDAFAASELHLRRFLHVFGSVDGDRARQFPDFTYRFASCVPLLTCERVDFVVEVDEDDAGKSVVQVFLLANKSTIANQRKLIFKFYANTCQMQEFRELAYWAATEAFNSIKEIKQEEAK